MRIIRLGIRTVSARLAEMGWLGSRGNPLSFSTIRNILSNPKYKGYYCGRKSCKFDYKLNERKYFAPDEWVMYKDEETVPPIVSEELWEKANLILAKRSKTQSAEDKTSYQNKYPYSGKIICGIHKQPYYHTVYRYPSRGKRGLAMPGVQSKGKTGLSISDPLYIGAGRYYPASVWTRFCVIGPASSGK